MSGPRTLECPETSIPRHIYVRGINITDAFKEVAKLAAWKAVCEKLGEIEMPMWFTIALTRMVMKTERRIEIHALNRSTLLVRTEDPSVREALRWLGGQPWDINTITEMDPRYTVIVPPKESLVPPSNAPAWLTLDG